jgi:DNA-binding MarR family transcriptional regulator
MFCYCAESRRLTRTLNARYDAALSKAGITAAQFETLSILELAGPCTGRALAERLMVDKTTLSRSLKPLLEAELICAAQDGTDARSVRYSLTGKGKRRLAKPLWQQVQQDVLTAFGKEGPAAKRLLQSMVQALHEAV